MNSQKRYIYVNDLPLNSPFRKMKLKDLPQIEVRNVNSPVWKSLKSWEIAEKSFNSLSDNWKIYYEFRFLVQENLSLPLEALIAIVLFSLTLLLSFLLTILSHLSGEQ